VCVLLPGRIKPASLAQGQEEYARRLKPFGVDVVEYKDEKVSSRSPLQVKEAEAGRIAKCLKEGDFVVACDERGKPLRTPELVDLLHAARNGAHPFAGRRRMVIVVGGALGLADSFREQADAAWALSPLVMAGGVARIVLLEGLYRAFTVLDGHPYHNE